MIDFKLGSKIHFMDLFINPVLTVKNPSEVC